MYLEIAVTFVIALAATVAVVFHRMALEAARKDERERCAQELESVYTRLGDSAWRGPVRMLADLVRRGEG